MAAFMNASYETPGERRPLEAVGVAFAQAFVNAGHETPAAPQPREAVGAAFARAFATWTAPMTNADSHVTLAPLAAVFENLPLELTAKCVMAAMGLRWKHVCDKIRKHAYAIQNEQYLMPPLEYPVFEPVRSGVLRGPSLVSRRRRGLDDTPSTRPVFTRRSTGPSTAASATSSPTSSRRAGEGGKGRIDNTCI